MAFAIPKFPSSFQSQSGCGIADDPISPALFLFEIFHGNIGPRYLCPMIMVFILFKASKMLQSDRNVRFVWSGKSGVTGFLQQRFLKFSPVDLWISHMMCAL
jgi:hypothetical protein